MPVNGPRWRPRGGKGTNMTRLWFPMVALVLSSHVYADAAGDRAKLAGDWQPQDNSGASWVVQHNADNIRITRLDNGQKVADFECNTMGRDCEAKISGRNGKVSMWYSGATLIVMETRGSEIVERHLRLVDADRMEIEVLPIVPERKPEVLKFVRRNETTARR
jgi:hypothetical protein